MNSVNFKIVKNSTKNFFRGFLFAFFYFIQVKVHALEVDFSRREPASARPPIPQPVQKDISPTSIKSLSENSKINKPIKSLMTPPQSVTNTEFVTRQNDAEILSALKKAVLPVEPNNEIVILNTENGFIPDKVRVKKGEAYKIHVVNLNMKDKNVSFLMDSFTQSHNTIFGVKKTFNIDPQVEGIYSYQCPETGIQGQLIVVPEAEKRKPASTDAAAASNED